jgi:RNA polymerase sigma-70 factor (ECF subfamily)
MLNDTLAFEALYKTYYNSLRNTAHNIIGDPEDAHDVVQEVFLKLWKKKESMQNVMHEKAYLFRSVINASLSHLENKKPTVSTENIPKETSESSTASIDSRELEIKIHRALKSLPPKCRTIFALSRFEDMKYKEIAEQLGVSVKTVENQMGIALKKMRADLSPYLTREFMALSIGLGITVCSRIPWVELLVVLLFI